MENVCSFFWHDDFDFFNSHTAVHIFTRTLKTFESARVSNNRLEPSLIILDMKLSGN